MRECESVDFGTQRPPTPTTLSMPPFTPKNREQKDREKARKRRGIFLFAEEEREREEF